MGAVSISRPHHAPEKVNHKASNMKHPSVNMYALPSEDRTWALIREYFQKTGQLLPFIHEESFCDTYFQMKQNNFTMARRTWLGLLNIILAMATTLSVEAYGSAKRIEESEVYYQRANALCDKEFKRNVSLELGESSLRLSIEHGIDTICSSVPARSRAIPTRNAEVRPGLDGAWTCHNDSFTAGTAFTKNKLWVFSPGI